MDRTTKSTFLNMCMIFDDKKNRVLIQDKIKDDDEWGGYTFPGGHIENGESFIDSVIREVKEETGLDISEVRPCGLVNWYNEDEPERWLVFLYKTSSFSGNLIKESGEGKVFWMGLTEFLDAKKAPNMDIYMKMFMDDSINEIFATWNKCGNSEFTLK